MWNVLLQLWHFVRKLEKRFFYIYEFQFTMLQLVIHSTNKSCPLCAETSRIGSHWEYWMDSFWMNWKTYVLCSHTVILRVNSLAMSLLFLMRCNLWLQRNEYRRSWPGLRARPRTGS
ncbi:hypothetical protein PVAP13_8NG334100 [Panicum virgatum]|uniref:Uncharacterized protein n=1 Tax=Panicum virgatum TaxID=38727 RepID=A0A8T0PFB0_PANVG|nr:hypothetical protein PVAP13_8NG334100 [Panicum virgatum]